MNHRQSPLHTPLPLELLPNLDEQRLTLSPDWTSEVEEDLESSGTRLIEELEAASRHAVHVPRLLHGERSGQLLATNVHVERIGPAIEELARCA